MQMRTCTIHARVRNCASTVWRNALPSFLRGDHRSGRRPSSSPLPSSISHANCFLCRSLIRIAKVSEEGRGGEEKAEEMLAKDARSLAAPLPRFTQWGEMDGNGEEEGGEDGGVGVDLGVANGHRQRGKCGGWKWPGSVETSGVGSLRILAMPFL